MGFFDTSNGVRQTRNYMCWCCGDTGSVSHRIFWRKVCPVCKGDPKSQLPPKPDPPPAPPDVDSPLLARIEALERKFDIFDRFSEAVESLNGLWAKMEQDKILYGDPKAKKPEGVIYPNRKSKT